MAVLPRKLQTIFADQLAASGNIAQPGSTVAGSTVYSKDLDVLQNLAAGTASRWRLGLQSQVEGTQAQVLEEMNGVLFEATQQLAYLTERGQSEWLATQLYYLNAVATRNGKPYQCIAASSLNEDPETNTNVWSPYFSATRSPSTLSAFVVFDGTATIGTNCVILSSFNVDTVYKTGTGDYLITFLTAMSVDGGGNGKYGFSGSAGTQNGATPIAGDNNTIIGGLVGHGVGVRTATQLRVLCWEAGAALALEDSGCITVNCSG